MLIHGWVLLALLFCVVLTLLALLRGVSRLLVSNGSAGRMEGLLLLIAGIVGLVGIVLDRHSFR
ncbi:MAG: hypothetical protein M1296_04420 [Chloroflexi bacterium]|nr:hypothetical protein [Chloroflexota bacterium]